MLKTDRYQQSIFFPDRLRKPVATIGTFWAMLFSLFPLVGSGTIYNACCCIESLNQKHVVWPFYHVQNVETNAAWLALFLKGGVQTRIESPVKMLIWNWWNLNPWQQNGKPHHAMALLSVLMRGANFLWWCSPMMPRSSWASNKSNPPISRLQKIIFDFLWIAGCFRQQLKQPWPEQHTTRRLRVSCTLLYSIVEIFGRSEKTRTHHNQKLSVSSIKQDLEIWPIRNLEWKCRNCGWTAIAIRRLIGD